MTPEERAAEVLPMVEQLRRDLADILTQLGSQLTLATAWERLKRWKARAVDFLNAEISPAEAKSLALKQLGSFSMIDPGRNFVREAEMYDSYLDGLLDDIKVRPKSLFGSLPVRIVPRAKVAPEATPSLEGRGSSPVGARGSRRVFIVHGHDEANLLRLEKLLRDKFKLTPVVLRFVAGKGRTLIEKFEQEADGCGFAFVLLTPDDIIQTKSGTYAQARPNVAFELGWFYSRMGRDRMTMLLQSGTQVHSDLDGISRVEFVTTVEEKVLDIERELEAAGLLSM